MIPPSTHMCVESRIWVGGIYIVLTTCKSKTLAVFFFLPLLLDCSVSDVR